MVAPGLHTAQDVASGQEILWRILRRDVTGFPAPARYRGMTKHPQRDAWIRAMREKCFGGWPVTPDSLALSPDGTEEQGPLRITRWSFTSQSPWRLPLVAVSHSGAQRIKRVYLHVSDEQDWAARPMDDATRAEIARGEAAVVFIAPRGIGPTAPSAEVQTNQPYGYIISQYKTTGAAIDRRLYAARTNA
jgi:hypothetical protein